MRLSTNTISALFAKGCMLLVCLASATIAYAEESVSGELGFSQDYPGRHVLGRTFEDVASPALQDALFAFYKVYERWPSNYGELRAAGFADGNLTGYQLQSIDPDDAELNFLGDLYYDGTGAAEGRAVIISLVFVGGVTAKSRALQAPHTFREMLPVIMQGAPADAMQAADKYLSSTDWLSFLSIREMLRSGVVRFKGIHRRYPDSMSELLNSGVCLITESSLNPLTGDVFHFDGREYDFVYKVSADGEEAELFHTEEGGSRALFEFRL